MQLKKTTLIDAVAYRGDTRPPEQIFIDGLSNRQTPESQWLALLAEGTSDLKDVQFKRPKLTNKLTKQQLEIFEREPKDCDMPSPGQLIYKVWVRSNPDISITFTFKQLEPKIPTKKDLWIHYLTNLPEYREGLAGEDISPKTAVCLTLRPHVAPYFPIDGCQKSGGEWIWMYAVLLGAAYKTYAMQQERATSGEAYSARAEEMSRAREVAVEHVSSTDVICAVHCWRFGKYPLMEFVLSPRICWNYRSRSRLLCQHEIVAKLDPFQAYRTQVQRSAVVWSTRRKDFATAVLLEPTYAYYLWQR